MHDPKGKFVRQFSVNDAAFSSLTNKTAWVLGLIASDGCVKNSSTVTVSQSHVHGLQRLMEMKKILGCKGGIYTRGDVHSLYFSSAQIVTDLTKFNVVPRKS